MGYVLLNGGCLLEQQACIPISDRGFQFGEGSFTTALVSEGQVEHWERHQERLDRQADWLGFSRRQLAHCAFDELIEKNRATQGLWRLKVIQTALTDLVLLAPYVRPEAPLQLSLRTTEFAGDASRYKTLAYLEHSRQLKQGLCVLRRPDGVLLEAPIANIYWRHSGRLYTPSRKLPLLWGITLQLLAEQEELVEGEFRIEDIPEGAELFLCNCLMGSLPLEIKR